MHDIALKLAFIGAAGIAAQWIAWRLHLPAIVLLLVAGFTAGPLTEFIDPVRDFGDIYRPVVSLAVAIILFEGGLTLNYREIRETSIGVRRLIYFGGPLVWASTALAAHYVGGLSWPTAAVLGAILVVTGPTVIMPMLRHAQLANRPASLLRWEAIVNDALGALFAVIAFETYLVVSGYHEAGNLLVSIALAFVAAVGGGYLLGRFIAYAFTRGHVPEYLKVPTLFALVIAGFALTNLILEEAGLLTVTVMGITLANSRMASLGDLRRFKEAMTVLLVSSLFILLTAALDMEVIRQLGWQALAFVALVMFVIRPLIVGLVTIGASLSWKERLLVGWIAPRGIVAVAVSGLFGAALTANGVEDGPVMVAYAFAVVTATILAHAFTLSPLARLLGLRTATRPGVLIVGGSRFTTNFAARLKDEKVPVLVTDREYDRLRETRLREIPTWFGEVLSEEAHHRLDLNRFSTIIAATADDAYNTLVCTDFGPEVGRDRVFQIGDGRPRPESQTMNFTLGGRPLTRDPELAYFDLRALIDRGYVFTSTTLTEEFTFERYQETRPEKTILLLWITNAGDLVFRSTTRETDPAPGHRLISFGPPPRDAETRKREHEEWRSGKPAQPDTERQTREPVPLENLPSDPPKPNLP
ncbi:cation:proton antiporter [Notoacmeibacter ruber]|uniref:Sodium:proton antiporter n=1 Tax=Notoacmeibacter ruber TaxID=2670375 RepID=A0A3L7JCW4_9HYPH|nr:sodium:proton antiporter [Notoacmeibacter ruber]RLQ88169.1 sodium:proton antiporter [Notoacmeibacter ruber]